VTGAYSLWQDVASYFGSGEGPATDADLTLVNEGTATDAEAGAAANELGAARENYVADMIGGQVPEQPLKIETPYGKAQIDVVGPNGELVEVGGPGKGINPSNFGRQMQRLQSAAESTGTKGQFYYDQGTPESILNIARKWLGSENVIPFKK
jgi:hypothetical protein